MTEEWNRHGGTAEWRWLKNDTETVEQKWWNNGKMMVEEWNIDFCTVEQRRWNSGKEMTEV